MSFDFDNAGTNTSRIFRGVSPSAYTYPLTMGCYVKVANHIASDIPLSWGDAFVANDSWYLVTSSTDSYGCSSRDSAGGIDSAIYVASAGEFDGIWLPWIGVVSGDTDRDVFIAALANTTNNTDSSVIGSMDSMTIGARADRSSLYRGLIAEAFFYNGTLSDADKIAYFGGLRPSSFAGAANLVGYYSLFTSDTTPDNESVGDGPALAQSGTGTIVFSADHPTMNSGGNPWYYYANQ